MALLGLAILILVIVLFVWIAVTIVKNIGQLVINAIIGLLMLFVVNYFHLMQFAGKPDIGYDWITIIICALAGLPGAILLIVLGLLGIAL
jgi:pro-sigmaK processing inhibitor BofA